MTPKQFAKLCRAVAAGPIAVDLADMPPNVDLASLADRLESGDIAGAFRYVYAEGRKYGLSQAMSLIGSKRLFNDRDVGPVIKPKAHDKSNDDLHELFRLAYTAKTMRARLFKIIVAGGSFKIEGKSVKIRKRRIDDADVALKNWPFRRNSGAKRKVKAELPRAV